MDGHTNDELRTMIDKKDDLYPDNPNVGSQYNTGNEIFGVGSSYKRISVILGDDVFHSQRRLFQRGSTKAGAPTYGYPSTDPPSEGTDTKYGGMCISRFDVLCGSLNATQPRRAVHVNSLTNAAPVSSVGLSESVMDYRLTFVSSLDPNDGLGVDRPHWPVYERGARFFEVYDISRDVLTRFRGHHVLRCANLSTIARDRLVLLKRTRGFYTVSSLSMPET
ncbi:hypothetical protein EV714DRAFT_220782 [Schizophyllum commune]